MTKTNKMSKEEKEFNLSEKIIPYCWAEDTDEEGNLTKQPDALYEDETLFIEDVKEFIRRLKEDIFVPADCDAGTALREMVKRIDKLAGKSLI